MMISDEDILEYIRNTYDRAGAFCFSDALVQEEKKFIVVKDIHEINEDLLNISKDIFFRGLQFNRQTNCINISNICDSLNAETCDLGEEIYKELERYNRIYTKAFIRNGSRWVDLKAFNLTCDKAKELIENKNPRVLFNISKYTQIINTGLLNSSNIRLSLVKLRSCLELMHTEIRKMNYDMVMQPVTTFTREHEHETLIRTKYVNNFVLHQDIKIDHEFQVFGIVAGLAARKLGEFGRVKPYYYQFSLYDVLKKEYGYLNLNVQVGTSIDAPVFVNNKQIAHKVLLRRKTVASSFAPFSKFTAKHLARRMLPRETYLYDYSNPIEISSLAPEVLRT